MESLVSDIPAGDVKIVFLQCSRNTYKRLAILPSPAGMSLTKLFLAARESLVSDIPAGDGKIVNLFYSVYTYNF
jgi:hypothetical protein